MERQTVGAPSDGGMPAAADGGMGGAGTHCSHQELKIMKVGDRDHALNIITTRGTRRTEVPLLLLYCNRRKEI